MPVYRDERFPPGVYMINQIGNHVSHYELDNVYYTIGGYEMVMVVVKNVLRLDTDTYLHIHKVADSSSSIITGGYNPS